MTKPSDPNRMKELGRRGGQASGEARRNRKRRGFIDVLRDRVAAQPEELVEGLMGSAAGAVVAARVLEKAGVLEPDATSPLPVDPPGRGPFGLTDIVAFAYAHGSAHLYGLPTNVEELAELMAGGGAGGGAPEIDRSHVPVDGRSVPTPVADEGGASTNLGVPNAPLLDSPPPKSPTPIEDFKATWEREQMALHNANRAALGLPPDDGNFDRPPRLPRLVEP